MNYREAAQEIYDCIGPAENIAAPYNCMTRLRFNVKEAKFTKEDLLAIDGVKGVNLSGTEWQIVLGPGKAAKVTAELKAILQEHKPGGGLSDLAEAARAGDGTALHDAIRRKNSSSWQEGLRKIARPLRTFLFSS